MPQNRRNNGGGERHLTSTSPSQVTREEIMEVLNDARRPIITICCLIPHIGIVEVKNDPRYFHKLFMFAWRGSGGAEWRYRGKPIYKYKWRNDGGEQKNEMIINSKSLNYMPRWKLDRTPTTSCARVDIWETIWGEVMDKTMPVFHPALMWTYERQFWGEVMNRTMKFFLFNEEIRDGEEM